MAKKSINIRAGFDMKAFSTSSQNLTRSLKSTGKKMQSVGKSMSMSLTAPIVALGGLAVKTFADFEQSMAKVKAISGATGKDFEALTQTAKDLGISTRFAASEVSDLMLNYSKLGFSSGEIQKITASTLDLALATGEDLATSAMVAGGTLRAFGLDASQMGMVTDVMAKSFSSSALDLNKFQVSMASIAPVAKGLGQSLQQTTAQLGVLVNNGIEASTAGTMLRNMMLKATKDGFSMDEALKDIASSTDKAGTSLKYFDTRATATALVLAENIDQVQGLNDTLLDSEGAAKGMADIMDNTLEGSMMKLKSATEGLGISFGEILAPAIGKIANFVSDMAMKFANLSKPTKNIILVLASMTAGIGPLIFAIGGLSTALAFLAANPILATLYILTAAFVALYVAIKSTTRLSAETQAAITNLKVSYESLETQLKKVEELKNNGNKLSVQTIKALQFETREIIKQTTASIKAAQAQEQLLKAKLETQMADVMSTIRRGGRGAEFIDVEMGRMASVEKQIAALSTSIQDSEKLVENATEKLKELSKEGEKLELEEIFTRSNSAINDATGTLDKFKIKLNEIKGGGLLKSLAPKETQITIPETKPIDLKVHLNKSSISETTQNLLDSVDEMAFEAKMKAQELGQEMGAALTTGLKDLATEGLVSLGQFIGDVMAGGDMTVQDFGRGLLDSIGKFMGQFGEAMIALGIAESALGKAIALGPAGAPLAIIGGVALVAAGAAISSLSKKGMGSGSASTSTSPAPSYSNSGGQNGYQNIFSTKISGRDLIIVQERESSFKR
jgi:hypothetical protein